MYRIYCRIFQTILRIGSYFLPWRRPKVFKGSNCLMKLPSFIKSKGILNVLLVTDKTIVSLGLLNSLLKGLDENSITYTVYDKTVPNPTIDNIEEAVTLYKLKKCKGILAFGGGSSMDCAKGVGARIAQPNKRIPQLKGLFKVHNRIPPLFAIPTTSGTGSEATIAAVITDSRTHEKYAVNDLSLIPHYAVLDPTLTVGLPQQITSTTGLDALTHAIEAYIGRSNTKETNRLSKKAVKLIFDNIVLAYNNGNNLEARKKMQNASFYAGIAFTRAYVGYVHAIAHTLGGFYSVPHGLANAVILPYVLEYYGEHVYKPLAELAVLIGIGNVHDTQKQNAKKFISAIKELNMRMNIPNKIEGIKDADIPIMVDRAFKEANPLYPVPKILSKLDLFNLYNSIK